MKTFIKSLLEKIGIRLNFTKNLKYLDSFYLIQKLSTNSKPVIFDVGACDGSSVANFKRLFPDSIIYSFEPYPESYKNLSKFSENFPDVSHYNLALSNQNGFATFFVNKYRATNSLLMPKITNSFVDAHVVNEGTINVSTKKLDTFLTEYDIGNIDILKLDVQGAELMVFEGAKESLLHKKIKLIYTEVWFIEGYNGQPLYYDIASYLAKFGYVSIGIYNIHYKENGHFAWGDSIFYLK